MKTTRYCKLAIKAATSSLLLVGLCLTAGAVELPGTIDKVAGDTIVIKLDSQFLPRKGDNVAVTTDHATLGTLSVGSWLVTRVSSDFVVAAKLQATGVATAGMRVTITSADPIERTALAVSQPVAVAAPPPAAKDCSLSSRATHTDRCAGTSVYVGPNAADKHGGVCLEANGCRLYAWRAGYQECGPYAVYAGPQDARQHGGRCVLIDEPGYRLRAIQTRSKSCSNGVYAGPERAGDHFGSCIELVREASR